jgi:catechol 2,3-dioxygenase-like lactoylglutathione lyase family enzyme
MTRVSGTRSPPFSAAGPSRDHPTVLEALDHLVIAVEELTAAIRSYERLGFTVVPGGRHPEGTGNALIAFADGAYLELLAFYESNPGHRWWPAFESGGGLIDVCLESNDLDADVAAFRRAGVDMADPEPGTRARPDGYRLRWLVATARGAHRGLAPFLIHDETPRRERVPAVTGHANGVTGLASVTIAVPDVGVIGRWYASALGGQGECVVRNELEGEGLRFPVGRHAIELLAPRGAMGPLAEWLRARGAGPYGAGLTTSGMRRGDLDPASAENARLTLL